MKITKKNKKLITKYLVLFFALSSFSAIIIYALSKNMVYFYTPTQAINNEAPINLSIRIGGMVKINSVKKSSSDLNVTFIVHDLNHKIFVHYEGILPDLFSEGQGIIMTGKLINQNNFLATEVLAKHDENYMPPEVADMMKKDSEVFYKK
ncbi:MAG: cytochrome c maturation protein CcmE [Gammaproteobacteria bacterium]|jgi:cytochrome c-type biogenesis protein CcmE|nr:cytochrome c maturation protein CcmE [Gammaproteobacteria bacterium]MBT7603342.1 cytochrome c maturation protein CcmE [Gammaproteobacteria bacterium]